MAGQHGTSLSELLNRAVDALVAARPAQVHTGSAIRHIAVHRGAEPLAGTTISTSAGKPRGGNVYRPGTS